MSETLQSLKDPVKAKGAQLWGPRCSRDSTLSCHLKVSWFLILKMARIQTAMCWCILLQQKASLSVGSIVSREHRSSIGAYNLRRWLESWEGSTAGIIDPRTVYCTEHCYFPTIYTVLSSDFKDCSWAQFDTMTFVFSVHAKEKLVRVNVSV